MKKTAADAFVRRFRHMKDRLGSDTQLCPVESFRMEMNSVGELFIMGVKEVPLVSETAVIVKCADVTVHIRGKGLILGRFSSNDTSVCGEIDNIELWKAVMHNAI